MVHIHADEEMMSNTSLNKKCYRMVMIVVLGIIAHLSHLITSEGAQCLRMLIKFKQCSNLTAGTIFVIMLAGLSLVPIF